MLRRDADGEGGATANRLDGRFGFATAIGAREHNEDFGACVVPPPESAPHVILAAIADGVGGARGGRVAAELTVRCFIDGLLGQTGLGEVRREAARVLDAVHRWLVATGAADPALAGMACTFTALVLRGRQAHVVHVGDSRLYRFRDNALVRLTDDHVGTGDALRSALTRAVGASDALRIDYTCEAARPGDRYLLCTDGVHGGLHDKRLRDELARRAGPDEAATQLVEAALASRIGDNATALVVDVLDLPMAENADLQATVAGLPILPPPRTGATVDGFHLQAMLSDGRYSRVFRAQDGANGRDVIAKFPKPVDGGEAMLRQAFVREAWIAARLHHPWLGAGLELPPERRTRLYAVMPFYQGETLEGRLLRPPAISFMAGLDLATKLAKAVAALHRASVIHRDIKPDNVIIERSGSPRLVDFGVARLPGLEDSATADTPGTPSYQAPELFAGAPGDERSDLFALGVTIYRMFAKHFPYGEMEPFSRPRFGRLSPLLLHRPDLPAWLDAVLARAIAVRPEDRFDDVTEFAFALEHGAALGAAAPPSRIPLYARNPLRFWQAAAAILFVLLIGTCALR